MNGAGPPTPPPDVDERGWWADRIWRPWIERTRPLGDATVLEYGCGPGSVSRVMSPHAGRYIGLDIDPDYIATAQALNEDEHATYHAHPPEEIRDALRSYAGEVDIVLLYAVIEHLTVPERLDVLATVRDLVRPDGAIVVVELPNRLTSVDHHSSFEPFLTQLPDELALDYMRRQSKLLRPEIQGYVLDHGDPTLPPAADEEGLLALRRFGRGASFHEFEIAWGSPIEDHVVATNWEPEVIEHREIDPSEVALARTLARLKPDLDPCWSRQWIDLILTPKPTLRRGPFHRPWVGHPGPRSRDATRDINEIVFLPNGEAALNVTVPEKTQQLAMRVIDGETETVARATTPSGSTVETVEAGFPGHPSTLVLDLPEECDDIVLELPMGGWVNAVTYRGHGRTQAS